MVKKVFMLLLCLIMVGASTSAQNHIGETKGFVKQAMRGYELIEFNFVDNYLIFGCKPEERCLVVGYFFDDRDICRTTVIAFFPEDEARLLKILRDRYVEVDARTFVDAIGGHVVKVYVDGGVVSMIIRKIQ